MKPKNLVSVILPNSSKILLTHLVRYGIIALNHAGEVNAQKEWRKEIAYRRD
jgi:hypothetical protein